MTYYDPNHGGDFTNPNHPDFVEARELPSDAVAAAYNLAAALIDQIIIEHRCKTERSFKSALKAFDACNMLSPDLEISDFESAKDNGCHAGRPDDELDAALTLHDLITDIYVRDDCEDFNASLKGLALWKSKANRNSGRVVTEPRKGLALWKSKANRNIKRLKGFLPAYCQSAIGFKLWAV